MLSFLNRWIEYWKSTTSKKKIKMETELTVTSELYSEKQYITKSKPTYNKNNVVSKFMFSLPPSSPKLDADGDLILERRNENECKQAHLLEIEHSDKTVLDLVGLQIWRGALLLADWLIYNSNLFTSDDKILELGSGVGLTSIVASMFTPVICTDIDKGGILDLIDNNVKRNKKYTKYPVTVKGLDFTKPFSKDIESILPTTKTILAADVIYDNDITEAFIDTLYRLLEKPPSRSIYVALEKRYVFMVDDLMTNAPCYDYFVDRLEVLKKLNNVACEEQPLDFPQYFDYDRVKQLVLWKISSVFK